MADAPTNSTPEFSPQVMPGAGYTPNVTPSAFGAGIGQAIQGAASEAQHYALMEKRYHDQEAAQDLVGQAQIARLKLKDSLARQDFNDADSLHGAADKALAEYNEQVSGIADKAGNDKQKAMLARSMRVERYDAEKFVQDYSLQQGNKIAYGKMVNGVKIEQATAAAFHDQPSIDHGPGDETDETDPMALYRTKPVQVDPVQASLKRQKDMIATTGQHLHWSPEQIQEEQAKATNATHVGVLEAKLAPGNDVQKAAAYYDKNKGELFPKEQEQFGKAIESATLQQQSGAITHEIMFDKNGVTRSETDVLNAMDKDKRLTGNAKLSDEVERQVGRHFRLQKAAKTKGDTKTYGAFWNSMDKVGGDVGQLPQAQYKALPPHLQDALMKYGKQIQENKFTPDNSDAFYGLSKQAASDPAGFSKLDLRGYKADLNPKDYRDLITMQTASLGKQSPEGTLKLNVASTKEQILKDAGHAGDHENDKHFRRMADQAVTAHGGWEKLGTAGYQKIVDDLHMNQATHEDRGWYNPFRWVVDKQSTEIKEKADTLPDGYAFGVQNLSADALKQTTDKLKSRGLTDPTEQDILDAYNGGLHAGP